jgi:hypothetical protein
MKKIKSKFKKKYSKQKSLLINLIEKSKKSFFFSGLDQFSYIKNNNRSFAKFKKK